MMNVCRVRIRTVIVIACIVVVEAVDCQTGDFSFYSYFAIFQIYVYP